MEASSADAKTSRRSSGFKMADTKALSRALAKGAHDIVRYGKLLRCYNSALQHLLAIDFLSSALFLKTGPGYRARASLTTAGQVPSVVQPRAPKLGEHYP